MQGVEFDEKLLDDVKFLVMARPQQLSSPPLDDPAEGPLAPLVNATVQMATALATDVALIERLAQNCVALHEEVVALRREVDDLRGRR